MRQQWKRVTTLFLVSQTLSLAGSSLVQYSLLWYVTLKTGSGVMMTVYIVCGFLPTFLLSPFAGVWADRFDRRKLIILADAMIALITLALALVFRFYGEMLVLVFAASALRAAGTAFQTPAVGAILPQFVPEDKLTRVNGINGSIQSAMGLAAPIVSGALMTLTPLVAIFYIDVVTAAAAIAILSFLRIPAHARAVGGRRGGAASEISFFSDMADGFRYIRGHRYLISFFVYIALMLFIITPAAFLSPLQVSRSFGPDVWRLTAIEITFSVGMMAGGAWISAWGGYSNRMRTMLLSHTIMAVCTLALGLVPVFWGYLAVMVIFGIGLALYHTPSMVMIQEHVEEAYLGRVFSIYSMIFTSVMPLGMLIFGPLAETVSLEIIMIGSGGALLVMGALVPLNRRLMAAGEKVARIPDEPADPGPDLQGSNVSQPG